jgi:hypothetical protein
MRQKIIDFSETSKENGIYCTAYSYCPINASEYLKSPLSSSRNTCFIYDTNEKNKTKTNFDVFKNQIFLSVVGLTNKPKIVRVCFNG